MWLHGVHSTAAKHALARRMDPTDRLILQVLELVGDHRSLANWRQDLVKGRWDKILWWIIILPSSVNYFPRTLHWTSQGALGVCHLLLLIWCLLLQNILTGLPTGCRSPRTPLHPFWNFSLSQERFPSKSCGSVKILKFNQVSFDM